MDRIRVLIMTIFYSPGANQFYDTEIFPEDRLPLDSKEISATVHQSIIEACSKGRVVGSDAEGNPIDMDQPPPTAEENSRYNSSRRAQLMSEASNAIAPLQDAVDLKKATEEEKAFLLLWKDYRVSLNRLDLNQADFEWPEQPAS